MPFSRDVYRWFATHTDRLFRPLNVLLSFLIFVGCAQETPRKNEATTLLGEFYVRYIADESAVRAEATFREQHGDSIGQTKDFDEVIFHKRPMDARDLGDRGIRFSIDFSENFAGAYAFEFGDKGTAKHKIDVAMSAIEDYAFEEPVSISSGTRLRIIGTPFKKEDQLVILFSDTLNRTGAVEISDLSGKTEFTIRPEEMTSVSPGKNIVYLVKKQTRQMVGEQMKFISLFEYYSKTKTIEIVR